MTRSASDAERDLRKFASAGGAIDFSPPPLSSERPLRHSSVLILFGALDRLPAEPADPATASQAPVPPELDLLLTRRADHMRQHPGQIAFPGGGAEPQDGGDPALTALREANEETGLDPAGVEVIGVLPELHIPVSNNLVTPVLGWWRKPSEVAADRTESVEVFRVPVAEMLDPAARGTSVLRAGSRTHLGPAFTLHARFGGHVVWGFTGMVIASLYEQLGWAIPWDASQRFPISR